MTPILMAVTLLGLVMLVAGLVLLALARALMPAVDDAGGAATANGRPDGSP